MDIRLDPGVYVVAVSGGVDSVALLHLLAERAKAQPAYRFVVAHLDHGIREDAAEDRQLVQQYAAKYGLPFVYHEAQLGYGASEAVARRARYEFLHQVRRAANAHAIITAHHYDDAIETATYNLFRGTGRKGVSSLQSNSAIRRPVLHLPKISLRDYAQSNGLVWREDSTNTDLGYTRNYIRHKVLPRLSAEDHQKLTGHIEKVQQLNEEIDRLLALHLHLQPSTTSLDRKWFLSLPHAVAREFLTAWLRNNEIRDFDKKYIEHTVIAVKTLRPGRKISLGPTRFIHVTPDVLALDKPDR